jgi:LPS export ABC transporter protein LptC
MKSAVSSARRIRRFRLSFLPVFLIGVSTACKNDIETINALTSEVKLPDVSAFNIEISYTDSGMLRGKIFAPEAYDYNQLEEPYTEFPKGIKVYFYDAFGEQTSYIEANYAVFYKKKQLWEGEGQVLAENPREGKKLETEQIFWDQKAKSIYSEKFSTITTHSGVSYGENGFEAKEDLSQYRMKGYRGKINVREDLQKEDQNP